MSHRHVHDYIDGAEPVEHGVDNGFTALGRRDVRTDEPFFGKVIERERAVARTFAPARKGVRQRLYDAFGPACDERRRP